MKQNSWIRTSVVRNDTTPEPTPVPISKKEIYTFTTAQRNIIQTIR